MRLLHGLFISLSLTTQNPYALAATASQVERAYSDALRQVRDRNRGTSARDKGAAVVKSLNATLAEGAKAKKAAAEAKLKPARSKGAKGARKGSAAQSPAPETAREPAAESAAPILDESTIPREIQFGDATPGERGAAHVHSDPNQKLEELEF